MTETPIPKLITSLSIPTAISMLITSVYNLADSFFVSQIGTSASGAVGIVFSMMSIIQAIGYMFGNGVSSVVSRRLGEKKQDAAEQSASSAIAVSLLFGLVFAAFGLVFLDQFMRLLGSTETILPYARDYGTYILIGAPIMCMSFVLNHILRSMGKTLFAMIGFGVGSILNIALDPIFIFVLGLGTAGAAMATLISQCISFLILTSFFLRGKSTIKPSIRKVSKSMADYTEIMAVGFASFCRQSLASVATAAQNVQAAVYGDAAVAAISIVGRVFMLMLSAALGFGQGMQPAVGYNYGAKKYARVRECFRFTIIVGGIIACILALTGFILAPQIIAQFRRDDLEVIRIGTLGMRIQAAALVCQPMIVSTIMLLQTVGKAKSATVLSCSRQGIFFFPMIYTLPHFFGLLGVLLSQASSDFCTSIFALPFLIRFFREMKQAEKASEQTGQGP